MWKIKNHQKRYSKWIFNDLHKTKRGGFGMSEIKNPSIWPFSLDVLFLYDNEWRDWLIVARLRLVSENMISLSSSVERVEDI